MFIDQLQLESQSHQVKKLFILLSVGLKKNYNIMILKLSHQILFWVKNNWENRVFYNGIRKWLVFFFIKFNFSLLQIVLRSLNPHHFSNIEKFPCFFTKWNTPFVIRKSAATLKGGDDGLFHQCNIFTYIHLMGIPF